MAFRPMFRQRAAVPAIAAVGTAVAFTLAPRSLHAEEPKEPIADLLTQPVHRKPIYDDTPLHSTQPADLPKSPYKTPTEATTSSTGIIPNVNPFSTPTPNTPTTNTNITSTSTTTTESEVGTYRPTPTDRLAVQIGHARLALYNQSLRAEDALNAGLTKTLRLEHSFTSTIRSLAPPKESGERLFPNSLYVLVAAMSGSIITRNRNILLRATVPAAIGLGAAYAVLPITMRNVGDLVWTYEERYPGLAEAHLKTKARVSRFLETGKAHSQGAVVMFEEKVRDSREKMEEWVRKGR